MEPARTTVTRATSRIGRYAVTGRLGRGGMGMVYRGFDEALEREVAIKTLTVEGTMDEESRRRFEIEAKAAARLQHPNILTVYELGQDRGVPFIAMELLSGADLESLLRSPVTMLLQEKLDVLVQVCRGLAFAHEHRIVHRDMKPSNVRILDDGTAKIMDFGIAKLLGTSLTRSGMMVGTVHYMSPEQIRAQVTDGRSDVFSVGVMLYELLAGKRPFVGQDPTQVLYKIVAEEPPPLEADLGEHGPRLREITNHALAKDVEKRLPSAGQLGDELGEIAASLSKGSASLPQDSQEALSSARRLLKEGRAAESENELRTVVERHPESLDARRTLRAALRETARREKVPKGDETSFPELEATFRPLPTEQKAETRIEPTAVYAEPTTVAPRAPAPTTRGWGLPAIGVSIAVVLTVALGLLLRPRPKEPSASPALSLSPVPKAPSPAPPVAPQGAQGKGIVKPAAPASPGEAAPSSEPVAPPGTVAVISAYPVDVTWKGKPLAQAQLSPRVSLPSGHQTLQVSSSLYALKSSVAVDVPLGGEVEVKTPPLGKISIRATPDNCEVLMDGVFLDYPPIIERPIAAGSRTVTFKWPDGTRREEQVDVTGGNLAYVTGRKD